MPSILPWASRSRSRSVDALVFAVMAASIAALPCGCARGRDQAGTPPGAPAVERRSTQQPAAGDPAPQDLETSGASPSAGEAPSAGQEPHTDQVPGALERMRPWPGLGDAVTAVVMSSPKGRIHGHDARRIDVEVDDTTGTARVRFVMRAAFELHGDRTVDCSRTDGDWSCRDGT